MPQSTHLLFSCFSIYTVHISRLKELLFSQTFIHTEIHVNMHVILLFILLQSTSLYAQNSHNDVVHHLPVQDPPSLTRPGRVLLYAPFGIKSIKIKIQPLMETLADRGHKVTVVMPYFSDHNPENIPIIDVEGAAEG